MPLPILRSDLNIYQGPCESDGSPTWTLHDPIRNKFFRIGELEYVLLKYWHIGELEQVVCQAYKQLGNEISEQKISQLNHFLASNHLLSARNHPQFDDLKQASLEPKPASLTQTFTQLFFFRIALLKPQFFLQKTFPLISFMYRKGFFYGLLGLGLLGLFLSIRQWHTFTGSVIHLLSQGGFYFFLIALLVAKIIHEFGHAYTAYYYRCKVATMGIAFMVFWPVLYTETTEAWKLSDKKARLYISAAGVIAELGLALLATLLWLFFPDGLIRSGLIMLATVTWLSTLLINLNPFMRFDGYYLFSDLIDIPNLQERSFSLARWNLREFIFKYNQPIPEQFPPRKHKLLLSYAYVTWLYRFFLYLGIALLVYHFVFKLAGIILMLLEVAFFIGFPVFKEVSYWWNQRHKACLNRNLWLSLLLIMGLLLLLLLPWQNRLVVPAVLTAREYTQIFPPTAAILKSVKVNQGQLIKQGDILIEMSSPDLEHQLIQTQKRIDSLEWEVNQSVSNRFSLANSRVFQSELLAALTEQKGLKDQQQQLIIKAPFDALIGRVEVGLTVDRWYSKNTPLLELITPEKNQIYAYINETDINRIDRSETATFIPDIYAQASVKIALMNQDSSAITQLLKLHQGDQFGGSIKMTKNSNNEYIPLESVYRWRFFTSQYASNQELKGKVYLNVKPESLLNRMWIMIKAVLIRESGF